MAGKMVQFPSNGHTTDGYLATPAGGKGPGVLIIQEWWGLVPHITDVCDREEVTGRGVRTLPAANASLATAIRTNTIPFTTTSSICGGCNWGATTLLSSSLRNVHGARVAPL